MIAELPNPTRDTQSKAFLLADRKVKKGFASWS